MPVLYISADGLGVKRLYYRTGHKSMFCNYLHTMYTSMLIKYAQFEREGERNTKVSKANANHPRNTRRGCKVYMSKNENKVRLVIPLKLPGRVKKNVHKLISCRVGGFFFRRVMFCVLRVLMNVPRERPRCNFYNTQPGAGKKKKHSESG